MSDDHDTNIAMFKVLIAWVGVTLGGITLSSLVLSATLIYTVLQIFVLARKMWKGKA